MPICIFCPTELDKTTKPEHILLNALGGRKTTTLSICSQCNNKFGGSIDNALSVQVMGLRNLLQLDSGTGGAAPTIKNIPSGDRTITIKGDGQIEMDEKPFIVEELSEGRWNVQIHARSEDHLKQIVPHLAAKLKMPEEHLRAQIIDNANATLVEQRPDPISLSLVFGGPDALRSVVKACLVLWSTLVGNNEVRGSPFKDARDFVTQGSESFTRNRIHIDSRSLTDSESLTTKYGPFFNLIYIRSDETGRVVGHFTLYNVIAWHITIAEAGGSPNTKIALISNPLNPVQWSDKAAEEFDVSFSWLNNPDYSDEMARSKARIENVMRYYIEEYGKDAQLKIISDCFDQIGIPKGGIVPHDKMAELSRLIAQRVAHHVFSIRYEENLTSDRIAEMLNGK